MSGKNIARILFLAMIAGGAACLWWYDPQGPYAVEMRRRAARIAEIPDGLVAGERLRACLSLPSCEALDKEIYRLLGEARAQGTLTALLTQLAGEGKTAADALSLLYERFDAHSAEELAQGSLFDDIVLEMQTKLGWREAPSAVGQLSFSKLLAFFLIDSSTPREQVDVLLAPLSRKGAFYVTPPLEELPRTAREALLDHMLRKRVEEASRGFQHRPDTERMLRSFEERLEAGLRP